MCAYLQICIYMYIYIYIYIKKNSCAVLSGTLQLTMKGYKQTILKLTVERKIA